jgi:hypothetical protein
VASAVRESARAMMAGGTFRFSLRALDEKVSPPLTELNSKLYLPC